MTQETRFYNEQRRVAIHPIRGLYCSCCCKEYSDGLCYPYPTCQWKINRSLCCPAAVTFFVSTKEESGGVVLTLDLGKGKVFTLSGVPGRGPFCVSTVHPFLLDGLFVENLEEIQAQARRIQVRVWLAYSHATVVFVSQCCFSCVLCRCSGPVVKKRLLFRR